MPDLSPVLIEADLFELLNLEFDADQLTHLIQRRGLTNIAFRARWPRDTPIPAGQYPKLAPGGVRQTQRPGRRCERGGRDMTDYDRFKQLTLDRELERLAEYRCSFVIVEAHLDRIVTDLTLNRMSPAARIGTLTAWWHQYPTVQWLFAPGPEFAARIATRVFDRHIREIESVEEAAA